MELMGSAWGKQTQGKAQYGREGHFHLQSEMFLTIVYQPYINNVMGVGQWGGERWRGGGGGGDFAQVVMSGQLVSLVKILTLSQQVCFKTLSENLDGSFPWGSITRAEKKPCVCVKYGNGHLV